MAKSLRSHKKRAHRSLKRTTVTDYSKAAASRTQRLAEKLKVSAMQPKRARSPPRADDKEAQDEADAMMAAEPAQAGEDTLVFAMVDPDSLDAPTMDEDEEDDAAPAAKMSTSGPRASGRELWKLERGKKVRKTPGTVFGKSKRSRKGGRVKP